MRHRWWAQASMAVAWVAAGCASEPLTDDQANEVLAGCCAEARGRVEIARDVESQNFRDRCGRCKRGNSKRECESAAAKVQEAVRRAYGDEPLPLSCTTLRSQLGQLGVTIPPTR